MRALCRRFCASAAVAVAIGDIFRGGAATTFGGIKNRMMKSFRPGRDSSSLGNQSSMAESLGAGTDSLGNCNTNSLGLGATRTCTVAQRLGLTTLGLPSLGFTREGEAHDEHLHGRDSSMHDGFLGLKLMTLC
eukprot:g7924.t1